MIHWGQGAERWKGVNQVWSCRGKVLQQRGGVNTLSGSRSDRASGVMEDSDGPQSSQGQPGRPWGPGYHVAGDCEGVMVPWELCTAQVSLGIQ